MTFFSVLQRGGYKIQIVSLYKVLNSISKKGHHVLVQERMLLRSYIRKICLKVLNPENSWSYNRPPDSLKHDTRVVNFALGIAKWNKKFPLKLTLIIFC